MGYVELVRAQVSVVQGRCEVQGRIRARLNVDGDRAAAAVAGALHADTLAIMTNVPGLLSDPADAYSSIRRTGSPSLSSCL